MIERINEEELRSKYIWKFLARNPNFQADLKSLETILAEKLDKSFEEKFHMKRRKDESLQIFIKRIFLKAFFNVESELLQLLTRKEDESLGEFDLRTILAFTQKSELINFIGSELLPPISAFHKRWGVWYPYIFHAIPDEQIVAICFPDKNPTKIHISIDLTKPKKYILSEVKRNIDLYKRDLHKVKKIKKRKHHWHLYDEWLKIYDLKQKGKTFEQIAKILEPRLKGIKLVSELSRGDIHNDDMVYKYMKKQGELLNQGYSDDEAVKIVNQEFGVTSDKENRKLWNAIRRVWHGYQQAEKLINGGYREL